MANLKTLGKQTEYIDQYAPELLEAIPRNENRVALLQDNVLPFTGEDLWTAWELSWLNNDGVPQVAIAEIIVTCESVNICESKSLKLYLNSFNQTRFDSLDSVLETIEKDLENTVQGRVELRSLSETFRGNLQPFSGTLVDNLKLENIDYEPSTNILQLDSTYVEKEQLFSRLLKSNCPVTNQPDWASIWIEYSGQKIQEESFLKYVVSYRSHQDFHENCVEKFFVDIMEQCSPDSLSVYARYTRRGGLDINPFRTNDPKRSRPPFYDPRQ